MTNSLNSLEINFSLETEIERNNKISEMIYGVKDNPIRTALLLIYANGYYMTCVDNARGNDPLFAGRLYFYGNGFNDHITLTLESYDMEKLRYLYKLNSHIIFQLYEKYKTIQEMKVDGDECSLKLKSILSDISNICLHKLNANNSKDLYEYSIYEVIPLCFIKDYFLQLFDISDGIYSPDTLPLHLPKKTIGQIVKLASEDCMTLDQYMNKIIDDFVTKTLNNKRVISGFKINDK